MALASTSNSVRVWDFEGERHWGQSINGSSVDISDDGNTLAILDGDFIKIYTRTSLDDDAWVQKGSSIEGVFKGYKLSGNGKFLVTTDEYNEDGYDGRIRVFSLETNEP